VLKVEWQQLNKSVEIIGCHRFDKESTIMGEEKEASTSSHSFSSFEHVIDISFVVWTETLYQTCIVKAIHVSQISKNVRSKLDYFDVFIDHDKLFVVLVYDFFKFCFEQFVETFHNCLVMYLTSKLFENMSAFSF